MQSSLYLNPRTNCERNIYRLQKAAKERKKEKNAEVKRIKCIIMANPEQQMPTYILTLYKYDIYQHGIIFAFGGLCWHYIQLGIIMFDKVL